MPDATDANDDDELIVRVAGSTGLSHRDAARVVADVVAYFHEPTDQFVRRRHEHLQADGLRNEEIFLRISSELSTRVVSAPPLTPRQLRRIVYS